jgi:hypothetical protein
MAQESLVDEQIEAGSRFLVAFNNYKPLKAAFWLLTYENDRWYLYLASDKIDDSNFDIAYGEVIQIAHKMDEPKIDPFWVKIVFPNDPLMLGVVEIQRSYQSKLPVLYRRPYLGGIGIDEAYIYPMPVAATPAHPVSVIS